MSQDSFTTDFLVIGGGIVGIATALELRKRFSDCSVTVIEKETTCGFHSSGRNSGVLHAGFYYTADSLKARFTRDGNKILTQYCLERGLKINRCGKLVVAKSESELEGIDLLLSRGRVNGVRLEKISEAEAKEIEPRAVTFQHALFSPDTSSVDPKEVVSSLVEDAKRSGITIMCRTKYIGRDHSDVLTTAGRARAGYVINAAGLYADKVAGDFGFSDHLKIIPFKGLYLYSNQNDEPMRTHVYPVPDMKHPFLGVHFTLAVDGRVKIGPTAIPAFWRENYEGIERFDLKEFFQVVASEMGLFVYSDFEFHKLAIEEMRKHLRSYMVKQGTQLVQGVKARHYMTWGKPGIRAQLYNTRQRRLIMDFCVHGDEKSLHVLNAVSPAFTASIPFAGYVCDKVNEFTTHS